MKKKVMLCILDGWGLAKNSPYNAISEATDRVQIIHHLQDLETNKHQKNSKVSKIYIIHL